MAEVLRNALMYAALPLWSLAGLADWWCHRRSGIERTSGVRESIFHWVMFAQVALGSLAALLLDINALVLVLLTALFCLHEATTWFELRFVHPIRNITPTEQMVHSFLELIPLAAIVMLGSLHAQQFSALWGAAAPDWGWRLKSESLPRSYLAGALIGIFLLNVVPLIEEFGRCWQWRAQLRLRRQAA